MPSGHIDPRAPPKPLSAHAWAWLTALCAKPYPCYQINAGVIDRFLREGLVDVRTIEGAKGLHVIITKAGREKVAGRDA